MSLETSTAAIARSVEKSETPLGKTLMFNFADDGAILVDGDAVTNPEDAAKCEDVGCTINMSLENFESMLSGELNPMMAFMSGKIKIDGDMGLAMKLQSFLSAGDD